MLRLISPAAIVSLGGRQYLQGQKGIWWPHGDGSQNGCYSEWMGLQAWIGIWITECDHSHMLSWNSISCCCLQAVLGWTTGLTPQVLLHVLIPQPLSVSLCLVSDLRVHGKETQHKAELTLIDSVRDPHRSKRPESSASILCCRTQSSYAAPALYQCNNSILQTSLPEITSPVYFLYRLDTLNSVEFWFLRFCKRCLLIILFFSVLLLLFLLLRLLIYLLSARNTEEKMWAKLLFCQVPQLSILWWSSLSLFLLWQYFIWIVKHHRNVIAASIQNYISIIIVSYKFIFLICECQKLFKKVSIIILILWLEK